ncbi:MAG: hypothetical protein ABIO68_02155 [Sphingomicrobium sp.]
MHSLVLLFRLLLVAVVVYAVLRGGRDERMVAAICVIGTIVSQFVAAPLSIRFASVETNVVIVDVLMLAAFVQIALRSHRYWPLWVAGLQLTTILGHILKHSSDHILAKAYGVALGFWAYPILLILAVGVHRTARLHFANKQPRVI